MKSIIDHPTPETFVLATGKSSTVRQFVEMAFRAVGVELLWRGTGTEEEGICQKTGRPRVKVNSAFFRPAEVDHLVGDSSRAKAVLGWEARTSLADLCSIMVEADVRRNKIGFSF
jgi:GDPmannose 4,6-dehydratase